MKKLFIISFIFLCGCKNYIYTNSSNDSYNWVGGVKYTEELRSSYKSSLGKSFMISTSDKLSSEAGAEILKQGGNAVDAAIASQMVLNVVEPHSSGIGGGIFLLYYDAKTKKTVYFNGRETAPLKSYPEIFLDKNGNAREFNDVVVGGLSVGTPGALKALEDAHKKYGKLPWKDLFKPAIKIANNGFIIDEEIYGALKKLKYLRELDSMKIYLNHDGSVKKVGTIIKNFEIARSFEAIAKNGAKEFYEGKIARDIVAKVQNSEKNPGSLSLEDLKRYQVKTGNLICGSYRSHKICSMPLPSSGGVTILQILGILENFDLAKIQPSSLEAVHLISEATKLAYADRNEYIGDLSLVPIDKMLDKKYLKQRASLIKADQVNKNVKAGSFEIKNENNILNNTLEKPSTTHVSIVDKYGNAVSMTSSIEYFFGSGLMVDGFMLNNQMTDFSLSPVINGKKVANRVEPLKQPRSSMSPTFVFDKKNNLVMVIGSPGGPRIIQYVLKTIIAHLDWGFDIQESISLPNHIVLQDVIELEDKTSLVKLKSSLEKIGHEVAIKDITSGIQGISISKNIIKGGADPRRFSVAIGDGKN